jgi:type II secretory pathway component PulM
MPTSTREKMTMAVMFALAALLSSALAWLCLREPMHEARSDASQALGAHGPVAAQYAPRA